MCINGNHEFLYRFMPAIGTSNSMKDHSVYGTFLFRS